MCLVGGAVNTGCAFVKDMNKKIVYYTELDYESLEYIAKAMDFGVSLTVMAALNELLSAIYYLRESRYYRHQVKGLVNETLRRADAKKNLIVSMMNNKGFWAEYSDRVIDLAESDISEFRNSICRHLDREGVSDSVLFSYVETARIMLDMAVNQWQAVVDEYHSRYGAFRQDDYGRIIAEWVDHSAYYTEYKLDDVFTVWRKVCVLLYRNLDIDLETPDTNELFLSMCKKFAEGEYIDDCLDAAKVYFPDFVNEIQKK